MEELTILLVREVLEDEGCYDDDDDHIPFLSWVYYSPGGDCFYTQGEAIADAIRWLDSECEEENNCKELEEK